MAKHRPFYKVVSLLAAVAMMCTLAVGTVYAEDAAVVRQMEYLDRGLVAMQTSDGIYMSWRFLGTDPDDVSFNVYRDGTKIATVSDSSNYTDASGTASSVYTVSSVIGGVESAQEGTYLPVLASNGTANGNYIDMQLKNPGTRYSISFRNARQDLYDATGEYYYMPVDLDKLNAMQTVVTDYKAGTITQAEYDAKVAEFKAYTDELGLDATGGTGQTLRELGYTSDGVTPLRTNADGSLAYTTATYTANDMSVADLDGDGQYELIVKWDPSDSRDSMISYATSAPCIIDAYDIVDGEAVLMYRIDMGYNIRAGAHDTQMQVYDFDGDGKSEIILRTADGTSSGTLDENGNYVPNYVVGNQDAVNIEQYLLAGNAAKVQELTTNILKNYSICWEDPVYNNDAGEAGQDGYITTGAYAGDKWNQTWSKVFCYGPTQGTGDEFITAFDGATGAVLDSVDYVYEISEDMWGITPYCRRSAGCSGKIADSDSIHQSTEVTYEYGYQTKTQVTHYGDPDYVSQYFWVENDNANDIGNNYEMFNDSTGNRSGRFLGGVALLDGETPSALICRGYYARTTIAAYNLTADKKLVLDSTFDSAEYENHLDYECRGNHNLSVGDVDGDGYDEILYGSIAFEKTDVSSDKIEVKYVIGAALPTDLNLGTAANGGVANTDLLPLMQAAYDENGNLKEGYKFSYFYHGDAIHLLPMNSSNTLAIFTPHEDSGDSTRGYATNQHSHIAATGEITSASFRTNGGDQARGAAGNIDPRTPDTVEVQGSVAMNIETGEVVNGGSTYASFTNGLIYWTGSLVRQVMDSSITQITATGASETVMEFTGTSLNNTSKNNPCLQADLFGDWREEVIRRSSTDSSVIRIYTTNMETEYKLRTLMHDPIYRLAVAWQNTCYNQPPHPSFFLGYEADYTAINNVDGSIIPDSDPIISTGYRTDIVIQEPATTASTDKSSYAVDEKIVVTVETPSTYEKVYMANESGNGLVATYDKVDNGTTTIWKITIDEGLKTKGDRTLTVIAGGQAKATVNFTVGGSSGGIMPTPSDIVSATAPESAKVNEPFTFTVVTTGEVEAVRLFSETGTALKPEAAVASANADGSTTWTCTMRLGTAGKRTLTVKVAGSDNVYVGNEVISFTVSK